ncbi:hypothetical protein CapIbe_005964 [Capra ibex]
MLGSLWRRTRKSQSPEQVSGAPRTRARVPGHLQAARRARPCSAARPPENPQPPSLRGALLNWAENLVTSQLSPSVQRSQASPGLEEKPEAVSLPPGGGPTAPTDSDDSTAPQSPALGTRGPLAVSVRWHHARHAAFPHV